MKKPTGKQIQRFKRLERRVTASTQAYQHARTAQERMEADNQGIRATMAVESLLRALSK